MLIISVSFSVPLESLNFLAYVIRMGLGINFVLVILVFGKAPLGLVLETGLKTFEGVFCLSTGLLLSTQKCSFVFDKDTIR